MFHAEGVRVDGEDITVEGTGGMTRVASQKTNAWDLAQRLIHVICHRFAFLCLSREALNADQRQRRSDLTQPKIAADLKFLSVILGASTQRVRTATVNDRGSFRGEFRRAA